MIDTMFIKLAIPKKVFHYMFEALGEYLKIYQSSWKKSDSSSSCRYYTTRFSKQGFLEIGLHSMKHQYALAIKLQPIRLIRDGELVSLVQFDQYDAVSTAFNYSLKEFFNFTTLLSCLEFSNWTVSRIDYAINYYTPYVKCFIDILHKGKIPKGFTKHDYQNSLYLTSDAVNINFYDKFSQLHSKSYLDRNNVNAAKNILRFEVQCKNDEIQRLKPKFGLETSCVDLFWDANVAEYVLKNRIKSIVGEQDFYSLAKANQMLSSKSKILSPVLYAILDNIDQSSNLELAKQSFCSERQISSNKYDKLLVKIRDQNINPITISDKQIENAPSTLINPCRFLDAHILRSHSTIHPDHYKNFISIQ